MVVLMLGLVLVAGSVGYGTAQVSIGARVSCGTGFSQSNSVELTAFGKRECEQARSGRRAVTLGLLFGGLAGVVLGAIALAVESAQSGTRRTQATAAPSST